MNTKQDTVKHAKIIKRDRGSCWCQTSDICVGGT